MADTGDIICGTESISDGVVIRVSGDIDFSRSPQLREGLLGAINDGPARLVIDLNDVPYMDSSGLASLVEVFKAQNAAGGKLVLCNLQSKVRGIFEIAKLDQIFKIADDVEQATTV